MVMPMFHGQNRGINGFNPPQREYLQLWINADNLILDTNGYVDAFVDLSPVADSPVYVPEFSTGKPSVLYGDSRFNYRNTVELGACIFSHAPRLIAYKAFTLFFVIKEDVGYRDSMYASCNFSLGHDDNMPIYFENAIYGLHAGFGQNEGPSSRSHFRAAIEEDDAKRYRTRLNGHSCDKLWLDGIEPLYEEYSGFIPTHTLAYLFGTHYSEPIDTIYYFHGTVAEVLYYGVSLSDVDRQTVEVYLKEKYGL